MWVGSAFGKFSESRFRDRIRLLSVVFAFGYALLALRLFFLQVVKGESFSQISESNRTQILYLRAPRGNFFDRAGKILVTNRPSWALVYSVPTEFKVDREDVEKKLQPFLKGYDDRWKKRLQKAFETKKMVRLLENVPPSSAFGMREMGTLLPGARMDMEFSRDYAVGNFNSHLIGYLGEIDEKELSEEFWDDRKSGDMIGKMGLEKILDDKIRGVDGGTVVEVDSRGRLKRIIRELPYKAGNSVQLTIDVEAQRAAIEGLEASSTQRGAAVAINVQTGDIYVWASVPEFDPTKSFIDQSVDPGLPFFDRVYKGSYPPGSIFKLVTALAALENHLVDFNEDVNCVGYVTLSDKLKQIKKYKCWKIHGHVNFWRAVAESCDSYFYQLGGRVGPQAIYEMARQFGLGESVQTLFQGENIGNIPNPGWKRRRGMGGWSMGDTYNMSIGQGYLTATPLQMAIVYAGIAARGTIFKPNVVSRLMDSSGRTVEKFKRNEWRHVDVQPQNWDTIFKATRLVVTTGTGKACDIPYLEVHGKTGTAQNPHGKDHAWFGGFAGYPGEAPQVAVCVFVENGGNGSTAAAPIARKIFELLLPSKTTSGVS